MVDFEEKKDKKRKAKFISFFLILMIVAAMTIFGNEGKSRISGWKPHKIKHGNGKGLYVELKAWTQELKEPKGEYTMPFGLAQMDNGEIIFICSSKVQGSEYPFFTISRDSGATWSQFHPIPGAKGRPMMLTWLGKGNLSFVANKLFFSRDYGRTWKGILRHNTLYKPPFGTEGNTWVDRDREGMAKKIFAIGFKYESGKKWPIDDATGILRWSIDEGQTCEGEVKPEAWKYTEWYKGQKFLRGISEGSIVRANNGWLVAALRSDMPARYLHLPNDDSLEGTAISISKDDGKTWSKLERLYDAGRHHGNLIKLPNGDLVLTMIVRDDVRGQELATHNRGCDALISHDNGLTWNLDKRYILDSWSYYNPNKWYDGKCGHLASIYLDDGWILTVYGNYLKKSAVFIKWKP